MRIEQLPIFSPKLSAIGMGGGHTYLTGETEWKGKKTPVFVFLKSKKEEKKLEQMELKEPIYCDSERYDFVSGHGLSLHGSILNQMTEQDSSYNVG